jgi:hypothetical protein
LLNQIATRTTHIGSFTRAAYWEKFMLVNFRSVVVASITALGLTGGALAAPTMHFTFDNGEVSGNDVTAETGQVGVKNAGVTTGLPGATAATDESFGFAKTGSGKVTIATPNLGTTNATGFTYSLFVRSTDSTKSDSYLSKFQGVNQFAILYGYTASTVQFYAQNNGINSAAIGGSMVIPTDNSWSHIAYSFDGSNLRAYLNGVLQSTTPTTASISDTITSMVIASSNSSNYFTGGIDDFQVYNTALSASAIHDLAFPAGTAVPEPASMGLLALGAGALLRRRSQA